MLDELRTAIDEADWPRALGLALEAWRETRSPALADLIDAIAVRCPRGDRRERHERWIAAALAYEPVTACALFDDVHRHVSKGHSSWDEVEARFGGDPLLARLIAAAEYPGYELPTYQRNRVERLCALARWPADPRTATTLTRWFVHDGFEWNRPYQDGPQVVLEVIAEELVRIGDARVVPLVAESAVRPRGRTTAQREVQQRLAQQIVDAIAPAADDPRVVAMTTMLAPVRASVSSTTDERALWEAVAREPDALGPRMVLADYLIERGDQRGELIALQCGATRKTDLRAERLIKQHWSEWLGDLALVIDHDKTLFDRGMLVQALIGRWATPDWAYAVVGDHRELTTVTRIAPSKFVTAASYAEFLSTIPDLAGVEITVRTDTLEELASLRPTWRPRALCFDLRRRQEMTPALFARAIRRISTLFPDLETLRIERWLLPEPYTTALRHLAVRRIVIEPYRGRDDETTAALVQLAATMPNVELAT